MTQPLGFEDLVYPHYICRLNMVICGLKQEPRAWFGTLASTLLTMKIKSMADSSLFEKFSSTSTTYVLVYDDDIIVTVGDDTYIKHLISIMRTKFALKISWFITLCFGNCSF